MELHYTIAEQDFVDYNLYYTEHSPQIQKTIRRSRFLTAAIVCAGGLFFSYRQGVFRPVSLALYLFLALVCFFGLPWYYKNSIRKNVRRTLQKSSAKSICGEKTLILSDTDVTLTGEAEKSTYPYGAFHKVEQSERQIFLFLDDVSALIVPVSAFANDAEKQSFIQTFTERMEKAPREDKTE